MTILPICTGGASPSRVYGSVTGGLSRRRYCLPTKKCRTALATMIAMGMALVMGMMALVMVVAIVLLPSPTPAFAADALPNANTGNAVTAVTAAPISATPSVFTSQTNSTYRPINTGAGERLYVGNRRSFKAYKHGGEAVFITMDNITNATLFINGKVVSLKSVMASQQQPKAKQPADGNASTPQTAADTASATTTTPKTTAKTTVKVDISKNVVSGTNLIRVEGIEAQEGATNPMMSIYIPYPTLNTSKPNSGRGLSASEIKRVDNIINNEVSQGFPGGVLAIVKNGSLVKLSAYGNQRTYLDGGNSMATPQPMTTNTMFDVASVTKVYATTLALMKLSYQGELDINKPVYYYLPDFAKNNTGKFDKRTVTVRNLLEHSAGFQPEIVFYNENKVEPNLFSLNKNNTKRIVLQNAPLVYRPGTQYVYSDTGFIILGFIVEKIVNMPLDSYVEQYIYKPMGLNSTVFNPLKKSFRKDQFAATEVWGNTRKFQRNFNASRDYVLQGEAHDEKAWYSMGGVSGHAGLFSNATDLAILGQLMLNKGGYGGVKIFDENTYNLFTKSLDNHSDQALGWRKRGSDTENAKTWMFGDYASYNTMGHTGWVGTLVMVDPEKDLSIVLLTNKKHTDVDENMTFLGDRYETGRYGSIINKIYEAL